MRLYTYAYGASNRASQVTKSPSYLQGTGGLILSSPPVVTSGTFRRNKLPAPSSSSSIAAVGSPSSHTASREKHWFPARTNPGRQKSALTSGGGRLIGAEQGGLFHPPVLPPSPIQRDCCRRRTGGSDGGTSSCAGTGDSSFPTTPCMSATTGANESGEGCCQRNSGSFVRQDSGNSTSGNGSSENGFGSCHVATTPGGHGDTGSITGNGYSYGNVPTTPIGSGGGGGAGDGGPGKSGMVRPGICTTPAICSPPLLAALTEGDGINDGGGSGDCSKKVKRVYRRLHSCDCQDSSTAAGGRGAECREDNTTIDSTYQPEFPRRRGRLSHRGSGDGFRGRAGSSSGGAAGCQRREGGQNDHGNKDIAAGNSSSVERFSEEEEEDVSDDDCDFWRDVMMDRDGGGGAAGAKAVGESGVSRRARATRRRRRGARGSAGVHEEVGC